MKTFTLASHIWLPRPVDEVFAFFADAGNLDRLTPPWMSFRIVTPQPIEMRPGTRIDYGLRVRGVPLRWQSEITAWAPPHRFADEQRRGPYRLWVHEHTFQESRDGTVCADHVRYAVWGGSLVNRLFVSKDLARIFAYRCEKLAEIFG